MLSKNVLDQSEAALASSRVTRERSRALAKVSQNTSGAENFARGIISGWSKATMFIGFMNSFRGFWSAKSVGPIQNNNQTTASNVDELVTCRMGAGENDGNDYDKDRGATDSSGWSQDSRWEEAARLREIARAFENGAASHMDEAIANTPAPGSWGRPYEAGSELLSSIGDKLTAQDYYTRANRIENQIAQDASRESNGDFGCLIL